MDLKKLQGCGTALVTPFDSNGKIDDGALRNLVDWQIEQGISFLVPGGTTGESVTLSAEEHVHLVKTVVDQTKGRVPVVAGAGGYNTAKVAELIVAVQDVGAEGVLSVTPYYNKPPQEGLIRHYEILHEQLKVPMILYNAPGRTACNLLPSTVAKLARLENIVALKGCSASLSQYNELFSKVPEDFMILSGDDAYALPMIAMGAKGLISVASNMIPKEMTQLVKVALSGNITEARAAHRKWLSLMEGNFMVSNPIPVKYGLHRMGKIAYEYRAPLIPLDEGSQKNYDSILSETLLLEEK